MDIRLLGPIEVSLDDGPRPLGARQQRAVLAMLALQPNRAVSTDRLIEGLWGERAPPSAPKLVQLYVSQLRKLLGPEAIVTRGRGYELRLPADRVDVARFEGLVAAATDADGSAAARAREALALWRGAALADVADEPFAAAEIRRLDELRLRATELAIDAELAAGRHRELIAELDTLVEAHPLSERLHEQRMLALYRSGRQAEALEAYRHARAILVGEIGIEPGPELRDLHEAILRQDAAVLDLPSGAESAAPPAARKPRGRVLVLVAALALVGGLAVFAVSRWIEPATLPGIDENFVGRIDPGSATIRAPEYGVGRNPSALAAGGGSLWALSKADRTVTRIDRAGHRTVAIAAGADPAGAAFAAGSLWVTDRQARCVLQISPATNRVVRRIPVGNAPSAIAAGFGALWVGSEVDPTVARIDLGDGAVRNVDLGSIPTAIAAGAGAVWVTSEEGGTVFRIEPRSGEVEKVIGVGHGPVAIAAGEEAVWVVNRQDSTVWRIDPASDVVTDVRTVGRDPSAIAVDPDGVWVANRGDATLTRIDPATRRPAKTISVKGSPSAIAASDGSVWTAALAPPASHRGGKLRVEVGFLLDGKTPEDDTNGPTSLAYDGLLAYRRTGGPTFGTLVGNLATNVPEPSPDGKTYVFRLRRNIRYSNGEPVRPRDFRAAMESHFRFSPDGPFPDPALRIKGVPECLKTPARCDLSRGITSDPRAGTITLHLTEPDPDLLDYLTYPFAYLVPADHPFGHRRLPPGTGPYRVVSYDAKRGARLVRNPYFRVWSSDARPAGFADEIDVRLDADIRKQVAAVERGRADVVVVYSVFGGPLAPAGVRALATRDAGHLYTDASPETDFMFLNVRTPPFDDVRVRRALNYAVDRGALARLAGGPGLAQPTCQLVPPGFAGYVPSCRYTLAPGPAGAWTAPDTDAARRLIRESGTRGMHVTVWGYEEKRPIIRYFAALLHRLGYRSAVRIFPDYGAYRGPAARHAQIGIEGWAADVGAPGNFTPEFLCSAGPLNESHFCNRGIEARIDAARAARGRRALALWSDVYRRLSDAAPAVPFVNHRTVSLVSDRVGNFQRNPMWGALLDQLWVR